MLQTVAPMTSVPMSHPRCELQISSAAVLCQPVGFNSMQSSSARGRARCTSAISKCAVEFLMADVTVVSEAPYAQRKQLARMAHLARQILCCRYTNCHDTCVSH